MSGITAKSCRSCCVGFVIGAVALLPIPAWAVEIDNLQAKRDDKVFAISADVMIEAPLAETYGAARAFEKMPDYSPMLKSARLLGQQRLASKTRVCILGFCKTVKQVMRYKLEPNKRIDMKVIPGKGDLKAGQVHWRFEPEAKDKTRIHFQGRIEPDFWVPPLIGSWAVKKVLRKQIEASAEAIEDMVHEHDAQAPSPTDTS